MKFLRALLVGVLVGLATFIVGALLVAAGAPHWLVSLGNALEAISGLVGLAAFLYSLITGWPWPGARVA